MFKMKFAAIKALVLLALVTMNHRVVADVIAPTEDVMTSSFFFAPNTVRGYVGTGAPGEENRPTFRVSTDGAFGLPGAETIYLQFSAADFTSYTQPVAKAVLTMTSTPGGQGADASSDNPFLVSAHGVNSNPFTSIIDDTNPGGSMSWFTFYNNEILDAAPDASTVVAGFGAIEFNVTSLVNSWISGANDHFYMALTGKNDTSGDQFLHGFLNNSNLGISNLGVTYLTVTAVPEPGSWTVLLSIGSVIAARRRRTDINA